MTQTDESGSGQGRPEDSGTGIVDMSTRREADANNAGQAPGADPHATTSSPDVSSNTENVFEEENTEGFDIAPTGRGDLQERIEGEEA